jgi:hypothetical protein
MPPLHYVTCCCCRCCCCSPAPLHPPPDVPLTEDVADLNAGPAENVDTTGEARCSTPKVEG